MPMMVRVVENVPDELPDGWTPQMLDEHIAQRLRIIAQQANRQLIGDFREIRRVPLEDNPGWCARTYEQDSKPAPPPIASTVVDATRVDGAEDVAHVILPTPRTAIIAVRHPLATEALDVTAYTATGQRVNITGVTPIHADEVEVVVTPETVRLVLTSIPEETADE